VQSHALLHRTIALVETLVKDDGLLLGVDLLGGVRRREHGAEVVDEACDRVHVHNVVYEVVVGDLDLMGLLPPSCAPSRI